MVGFTIVLGALSSPVLAKDNIIILFAGVNDVEMSVESFNHVTVRMYLLTRITNTRMGRYNRNVTRHK